MSLPADHGVIQLTKALDEMDGREVTVRVRRGRGAPSTLATTVASPTAGPSRKDIENIAAEVTERILDYRSRRR